MLEESYKSIEIHPITVHLSARRALHAEGVVVRSRFGIVGSEVRHTSRESILRVSFSPRGLGNKGRKGWDWLRGKARNTQKGLRSVQVRALFENDEEDGTTMLLPSGKSGVFDRAI